jgi:hypothetical protein
MITTPGPSKIAADEPLSRIAAGGGPETFDQGLVPGFRAENELEWAVATDPEIQRGWAFPVKAAGHPEPPVGAHVAAILRKIGPGEELRSALRFVALVHDSLKWAVRGDLPWSPDNDHAALARRVAGRHTSDRTLLLTIELHDEAYWIFRYERTEPDALDGLLARLPDVALYVRFVELDAAAGGKDPTFLVWLRNELALRSGEETTPLIEWAPEPAHEARFAAAL